MVPISQFGYIAVYSSILPSSMDAALGLLNDVGVDAIIGPQTSSEASFVIGLGDRANVPIISFSATSPSLHPISR